MKKRNILVAALMSLDLVAGFDEKQDIKKMLKDTSKRWKDTQDEKDRIMMMEKAQEKRERKKAIKERRG